VLLLYYLRVLLLPLRRILHFLLLLLGPSQE
jgi:hypothetical protein